MDGRIFENFLSNEIVDDDLLNELADVSTEECLDLLAQRELALFLQQLASEKLNSKSAYAERMHEYAMGNIKCEACHRASYMRRLTDFLFEKNEDIWGWVIWRFNMLDGRDEVLACSLRYTDYSKLIKRMVISFACILVLLGALILMRSGSDGDAILAEKVVRRKTIDRTENKSRLVQYSDGIQLSMAPRTEFEYLTSKSVRLTKGEIWVDVKPSGEGFQADTVYGLLRVLGTNYGIALMHDRMLVQVYEGVVVVERDGVQERVESGQQLVSDAGSLHSAVPWEGAELPLWVRDLAADEQNAKIAGLKLHWTMEMSVNDQYGLRVLDRSGLGNHGIVVGEGRINFNSPAVEPAIFGSAVRFYGEEHKTFIQLPELEAGNVLAEREATVMLWAYVKEMKPYIRFLDVDREGDRELGLTWRKVDGVMTPLAFCSPAEMLPLPRGYDNQWIHLAYVMDQQAGEMAVYFNGDFVGRLPMLSDFLPISACRIGKTASNTRDTLWLNDAVIDEVRIYDRVLSAEEVRTASKIDLTPIGGTKIEGGIEVR